MEWNYLSIWGVSQNYGYLFGDPYNKDYSILGSILGSPYFGKLAYLGCKGTVGMVQLQRMAAPPQSGHSPSHLMKSGDASTCMTEGTIRPSTPFRSCSNSASDVRSWLMASRHASL